jgi:hypothetical protein
MREGRKADRIADRECMKHINAEMKADQGDLKRMMEEMNAKVDISHKKTMAKLDALHERTVASLGKTEATDFEANPEETEHQDILKEAAAITPVGKPRKWRRVCNLAAERRQKKEKERTQGNCESRRRLAVACRKVSRRAKVAWRKRNLFMNIRTLEYGKRIRLCQNKDDPLCKSGTAQGTKS